MTKSQKKQDSNDPSVSKQNKTILNRIDSNTARSSSQTRSIISKRDLVKIASLSQYISSSCPNDQIDLNNLNLNPNSERNEKKKKNFDIMSDSIEQEASSENQSDATDTESVNSVNKKYAYKKKYKYPPVRHHFERITSTKHKCKICAQKNIAFYSRNPNGGDANLRTHLATKHDMNEVLYESQKKKIKETSLEVGEKRTLDDLVVDAIVKDSRCFGDFNKKGLREFLKKAIPTYNPQHRNTIKKKLRIKYKAFLIKLKQVLLRPEYLALTTDLWKNKKSEYFLILTCHFFDCKLNYRSLNISFRKFKKLHDAAHITKFIQNEINKLNIMEKIVGITSDNEACVKRACLNLNLNARSLWVSCMAHNLNLAVQQGLEIWKKSEKEENGEILSDSEFDSDFDQTESENPQNDLNDEQENENDNDFEETSEDEIEEDSFSDNSVDERTGDFLHEDLKDIKKVLSKVRKLIDTVKRSNPIYLHMCHKIDSEKLNVYSFMRDVKVRWNTTYLMLERLTKLKIVYNDLTNNPNSIRNIKPCQIEKLENLRLSRSEWDLIEILKNILKPINIASKLLQGRKYHTFSWSKSIQNILVHYYNKIIRHSNNQKEKKMSQSLLEKLNFHLKEKLSQEQKKNSLIAAFLDPTQWKHLDDEEKSCVYTELEKLYPVRRYTRLSSHASRINSSLSQHMNVELEEIQDEEDNIFEIDAFANELGIITDKRTASELNIKDELASYIMFVKSNKETFKDFWLKNKKCLPKLYLEAIKTNTICGTSCPAESSFSIAGYIQRKERSSLSAKTLRFSLLTKEDDILNEIEKSYPSL